MKRRKKNLRNKYVLIALCILVALLGISGYTYLDQKKNKKQKQVAVSVTKTPKPTVTTTPEIPTPEPTPSQTPEITATPEPTQASESTPEPTSDVISNYTDILAVANKKNALPYSYEPSDLRVVNTLNTANWRLRDEAATAIETMFASAHEQGVTLVMCSGYRSASYQDTLYSGYVAKYGVARADAISSRPGYSDHQTGLAADIGDHDQATVFNQSMENTVEGQWLYAHAHEYGFILRYPKGKESITGYSYEPWHYRYVGVATAEAMYTISPNETLEEYLGVPGGDYR